MENIRKYDISLLGEFENKNLETDFLNYDMRRYAKFIGPVTLAFGLIYMLFSIFDYYAIGNTSTYMLVFAIRILVLIISSLVFLSIKKFNDYTNLINLVTLYEVLVIVSFVVILHKYENLTFLTLFSLVAIELALYVMPNRLINVQAVSLFLILLFFLFPAKNIEGLESLGIINVIGYNLMLFIFFNISAYFTNLYKRKQFADNIELLRVSVTDALTGIYNRAKFDKELVQWIDACNTYGIPLSLVIFDIDDFKKVNDCYGHHVGDTVIQSVVTTIRNSIRSTDIFARWGGEEFVILLPNTDIMHAIEMTERMRLCIQKINHSTVEHITCSFGLVALKKNESAESLIQRADKLLYNAKDWGKNVVVSDADGLVGHMRTSTYGGFVS